jgi:hypothetical protein
MILIVTLIRHTPKNALSIQQKNIIGATIIVNINKLYELAIKHPEASKRAAEGFEERLLKREKEFAEEAKKMKPKGDFWYRQYDI